MAYGMLALVVGVDGVRDAGTGCGRRWRTGCWHWVWAPMVHGMLALGVGVGEARVG